MSEGSRATTRRSLRAAALVCALCAGCASKGAPDTRRELLATWSTGLVVEGYRAFERDASALDSALVEHCGAPSDARLRAARDAWWQARASFGHMENWAFGPYSRLPQRIGPEIDPWPLRIRVEQIEALVAGDAPVTPEALANIGVNEKGLQALEYVLYEPNAATALAEDNRRCEYLVSVGKELVARATELRAAWDPEGGDFAGELSEAGRGRTAFDSLSGAFSEVVNRIGFTLENMRMEKVLAPLRDGGDRSAPNLAQSRFSGRSLEDMRDNLIGIERLYFGDPSAGIPGLERYLNERGRSFESEMRSGLDAVRSALDAVPGPLTTAVQSDPERVRAVGDALNELRNLVQVDLINALGLELDFNDNDGD